MTRTTVKFSREGSYAAEVCVELIDEPDGWAPYLSVADALRLDAVREAQRRGDFAAAAREGRVFKLIEVN